MSSTTRALPPLRSRLERLRRLTLRDRHLLALLAEHYLLSTTQITQALYPSTRSARLRLTTLHRFGALDRFADITTGSHQYLYALGPVGLIAAPTQWNDPDRPQARPPRSSAERTIRIVGSAKLAHLLGVNQFFIDLLAHTRTRPEARLDRWWSEQHATAAWVLTGIRPDGHGIWTSNDQTVGFFLEHDNGTEPLATVIGKLRAYSRLAADGPRYPVLLHVPSEARETHLLDALHGVPTQMPVAISTHDRHPPARPGCWPPTPTSAAPCTNYPATPDRPSAVSDSTSTPIPAAATPPATDLPTARCEPTPRGRRRHRHRRSRRPPATAAGDTPSPGSSQ